MYFKDLTREEFNERFPKAPIIVACKCGWTGKQDELMDGPAGVAAKYCPKCGKHFAAMPR